VSIVSSDSILPFRGQCSRPQTIRTAEMLLNSGGLRYIVQANGSATEGKGKHENKIVCRRTCCECGHDCSGEPRSCSRRESGRGSYTQCPGGSCSDAARRCRIVSLDADAVIRQQTVLFRPTLSLVWDAFVTILRVPAAHLFESTFGHAFRSIHGSNYPATQSCRANGESQKSSCRTRLESAKHTIPEWK
jgi:hypothetical protein